MTLRSLLVLLIAGTFLASSAPALRAQGLKLSPAKAASLKKQVDKSFQIWNLSPGKWSVGIDSREKITGTVDSDEYDDIKQEFKPINSLTPGKELSLPQDEVLILMPVPPKIIGIKTGSDFSGRLYLKDSTGTKIYFELMRATKGDQPGDKTCYFQFDPLCPRDVLNKGFDLLDGKDGFGGYFVGEIDITGATVPK